MSASEGLLQSGDGRRLLAAQLFDSLGAGVGLVALPWLVLDAGGDASTAGLVAVFGLVPYVLFGLFAGVTGDRRSRRRVIIAAHSTQTVCALAVPLWAICGRDAGVAGARASRSPSASRARSPTRPPSERSRRSSARRSSAAPRACSPRSGRPGMVSGPALGGQLIEAVGPSRAIAVQCAAFALADRLRDRDPPSAAAARRPTRGACARRCARAST